MESKARSSDPWQLSTQIRQGEGLIVLGYLAGMVATAAASQALRGNSNDRWIFPLWALLFTTVAFWSFRRGTRRGAGRPWGVVPLLVIWGIVTAGQQGLNGWQGWAIGLTGLAGTNLIRLVAEKLEHSPTASQDRIEVVRFRKL